MEAAVEAEFREIDEHGSWNVIFQEIRDQSTEFPCAVARLPENKTRNRYRDVSPFDHSRICLQLGTNDYINASLISVHETQRSYILTQGPLPNTCGHFWEVVWEQQSRGVVMLNRVVEKGSVKCAQYWPSHANREMVFEDTNFKLTLVSENVKSYYTVRHLELENLSTQETREILHFHYTTWPDFGVPESPASFLNFLFNVRESECLNSDHGPVVVHCSAGIGRSGTFCLVDTCLLLGSELVNYHLSTFEFLEKVRMVVTQMDGQMSLRKDPSSVFVREVLLEMRQYRMGLIQTADQLRFSYLAVIEGAKVISGDTSVQESWRELSNEEDPPAELTPPPPRPPKRSSSARTGSFPFPGPGDEHVKAQHNSQANGSMPEPELRRRALAEAIDVATVPSVATTVAGVSSSASDGVTERHAGLTVPSSEDDEALPQRQERGDRDPLDSGSPPRLLSPLLATMCLGVALALGVYVCSRPGLH